MKKIISVLATYAGTAILAASFAGVIELRAQTATPSPAAAAAQGQCSPEAKLAVYTEFLATFKTDQAKGYELAQKYLACPTAPGEESYATYLRDKFVGPIDKARRPFKVKALVYEQKDYPKAFELGKQILADEPDNLRVLVDLGYAGYPASTKADTFNADSLNYAKKAIQLLESGHTLELWDPYTGKDEALGYLNNTLGVLMLKKDPSGALRHLLKAAQLEGKLKKDAITYGYIGDAYKIGLYDKLSTDYAERFQGKDETPESKLALANLNQVMDRMIDAYARAVALSGTDAVSLASKKAYMDALIGYYKFRHNESDAGLNEMIASITSKPLPPEPTPITTLPASTPATTATPVSGTATGSGNSVAATPKPATTPAATAVTTTAKTTTTTTTAVKPKPKNNHPKPKTRRGN